MVTAFTEYFDKVSSHGDDDTPGVWTRLHESNEQSAFPVHSHFPHCSCKRQLM